MNCSSCGRVVFPNQGKCVCGWKIPQPQRQSVMPPPDPRSVTLNALGKHEAIVNAYITQYRQKHPGASKREACLAFLKAKGLYTLLPKHLQDEAGEERAAIQDESTAAALSANGEL